MDTLNHACAGFVIADVFDMPMEISIIHSIIGAMPDIIGEAERIIKWNRKLWGWYNYAHNKMKFMRIIPAWALHIYLDKHSHGEGNRWWKINEKMWLEVLTWLIIITIFLIKRMN